MPTDPGPLRAGNCARIGGCGIVRVRPQPPQLSVGRRIGCRVRVRLRRDGNGGGQRGPRLAPVCGRQDGLRFRGSCWGDRGSGRSGIGQLCLNGGGCGIRFRARDNIGALGFHFDAAVTSTTTGVQFLIGKDNKQKEAEAKENSHGRYCDNAERDEVEQGADIGLPRPGALIRGIGQRARRFGRLWPRVSGCTSRPRTAAPARRTIASEYSAVHLAMALSAARLRVQSAIGDRKALGLGCLGRASNLVRPLPPGSDTATSARRR